jgi:L,D-peptidoglycan transpeptidase YkuD (ErfK/YbiS/YcfS/YnhG family)
MGVGRFVASCAAAAAVAGCAAVAINMGHAATVSDDAATPFAMPTLTSEPVPSSAPWTPYRPPSVAAQSTARIETRAAELHPATSTKSTHAAGKPAPPTSKAAAPASKPAPRVVPKPAVRVAPKRGQALPIAGSTHGATRVITVVASSTRSTTATLQAWVAAPGGGWLKHGSPVPAHVGADGLSTAASESRSATPIGSFSLTQAFGAYSNPGTRLPYFHTNASDWWISQSGPLYNTHQHCASGCGFTHGAPNEHLAYTLPFYRYAVVIDYNTRNAPGGVHQGKGSAFFLHVTDGHSTAGCVAIAQSRLVPIMQWLAPSTHPRILIGVA